MQVFLSGGHKAHKTDVRIAASSCGTALTVTYKDNAQLQRASPHFSALLWEWLKLDFFELNYLMRVVNEITVFISALTA